MSALSLRKDSAFAPFSLVLSNGATLTGISHIPPRSLTSPAFISLLVGIHGGSCTCLNYDIDAKHTASLASAALGVPFVAIDRPCYGGSTSFLPLLESQTFYHETARWEHEFILPALWERFGRPNNCAALVTTNHSMAAGSAIILASLYGKDPCPKYPLAGVILSGFGTRLITRDWSDFEFGPLVKCTPDKKKLIIVSEDSLRCADPSVLEHLAPQTVPVPLQELSDFQMHWPTYWKERAPEVEIPIMYAIGEHDWLCEATAETVEELKAEFTRCPRFDGSLVLRAPHALEWAYVSQGWYARCFGWAMEVCAVVGVKKSVS